MYKVVDKNMIEKDVVQYIPGTSPRISPGGPAARNLEQQTFQAEDWCSVGPFVVKFAFRRNGPELKIGLPPLPQIVHGRYMEALLDSKYS